MARRDVGAPRFNPAKAAKVITALDKAKKKYAKGSEKSTKILEDSVNAMNKAIIEKAEKEAKKRAKFGGLGGLIGGLLPFLIPGLGGLLGKGLLGTSLMGGLLGTAGKGIGDVAAKYWSGGIFGDKIGDWEENFAGTFGGGTAESVASDIESAYSMNVGDVLGEVAKSTALSYGAGTTLDWLAPEVAEIATTPSGDPVSLDVGVSPKLGFKASMLEGLKSGATAPLVGDKSILDLLNVGQRGLPTGILPSLFLQGAFSPEAWKSGTPMSPLDKLLPAFQRRGQEKLDYLTGLEGLKQPYMYTG